MQVERSLGSGRLFSWGYPMNRYLSIMAIDITFSYCFKILKFRHFDRRRLPDWFSFLETESILRVDSGSCLPAYHFYHLLPGKPRATELLDEFSLA